jgi:hypothetical protein
MGRAVTGSIRKINIDGIPFEVAADTNINETGSEYENSLVKTSGRNFRKMMGRAELRENVVLITDADARESLRELADRVGDAYPLSYETADGATYRADGWIDFENRETEESRSTIKFLPQTSWDLFA